MTSSEIRKLNIWEFDAWPPWLRSVLGEPAANLTFSSFAEGVILGALAYAEHMQSEWQRIAAEADSIAGYAGAIAAEARGIERRAHRFGAEGRGDGQ